MESLNVSSDGERRKLFLTEGIKRIAGTPITIEYHEQSVLSDGKEYHRVTITADIDFDVEAFKNRLRFYQEITGDPLIEALTVGSVNRIDYPVEAAIITFESAAYVETPNIS